MQIIGGERGNTQLGGTMWAYNRAGLDMLHSLCSEEIIVDKTILNRAEIIRHSSNIKYKDSIHLACAEAANADVLLTTDIKFMNNSNRIKTYTKVMNPNQYLLEVLY